VHVTAEELAAARKRAIPDRARYLPRHWKHGPDWVEHSPGAEDWFGFEAVRPLPSLDLDLLLVSLPGHSKGHAGVAIKLPDGRWLLHAGDAFFHHEEIDDPPRCPPGLVGFQRVSANDWGERNRTLERLRELRRDHGDEVAMICSHDPLMMVGV
jgi:glyoxylase-like metal-dependent hydrolase (beta-lactamase superfamily II)